MAKALGADINKFYNHHFPEGWTHEEYNIDLEPFLDDGSFLNLPSTEKFELSDFGCIIPEYEDQGKEISFAAAFKKWQREQTHKSVVFEIPKNKLEEVFTTVNQFFPSVKILK